MFQATFNQHLHGQHKTEEATTDYESYELLLGGIETYLQTKLNRFQGEMFEAFPTYVRDIPQFRELSELVTFLKESEETCLNGHEFTIHLQLDGSTAYGNPILQTIRFKCIEAHAQFIERTEAERLSSHRRYHYCGHPDCDWDCGTLPCGCIDQCRKFCDWSDDELRERFY